MLCYVAILGPLDQRRYSINIVSYGHGIHPLASLFYEYNKQAATNLPSREVWCESKGSQRTKEKGVGKVPFGDGKVIVGWVK